MEERHSPQIDLNIPTIEGDEEFRQLLFDVQAAGSRVSQSPNQINIPLLRKLVSQLPDCEEMSDAELQAHLDSVAEKNLINDIQVAARQRGISIGAMRVKMGLDAPQAQESSEEEEDLHGSEEDTESPRAVEADALR
jgi:hypothetical protein